MVSRMGKERSQETGVRRQNGAEYNKRHSAQGCPKWEKREVRRQNGAEYSKRHSARRVSRMRCGGVQNVKNVTGEW